MRGGAEARLLGKWGEMQVANYLRKQGYNIVDVNYRCRLGELDLVATNRKYLAFVEVKLRRNDDIMAARESVTQLQPRFDVAEIYAPQGTATRHPHINYLENAF